MKEVLMIIAGIFVPIPFIFLYGIKGFTITLKNGLFMFVVANISTTLFSIAAHNLILDNNQHVQEFGDNAGYFGLIPFCIIVAFITASASVVFVYIALKNHVADLAKKRETKAYDALKPLYKQKEIYEYDLSLVEKAQLVLVEIINFADNETDLNKILNSIKNRTGDVGDELLDQCIEKIVKPNIGE